MFDPHSISSSQRTRKKNRAAQGLTLISVAAVSVWIGQKLDARRMEEQQRQESLSIAAAGGKGDAKARMGLTDPRMVNDTVGRRFVAFARSSEPVAAGSGDAWTVMDSGIPDLRGVAVQESVLEKSRSDGFRLDSVSIAMTPESRFGFFDLLLRSAAAHDTYRIRIEAGSVFLAYSPTESAPYVTLTQRPLGTATGAELIVAASGPSAELRLGAETIYQFSGSMLSKRRVSILTDAGPRNSPRTIVRGSVGKEPLMEEF